MEEGKKKNYIYYVFILKNKYETTYKKSKVQIYSQLHKNLIKISYTIKVKQQLTMLNKDTFFLPQTINTL